MKLFFEKVRTPKKDMSLKIQIMVTIGIIVFGFALGVFQDDCHRIYTHRHLSHRAVLIFQASPYPEVLRDTFGSQGGSGIK